MGEFWPNFWIAVGALCGVLARIGQWKKPDSSKVDWWKAVAEIMTVPAIAVLVSGGVDYFAPDMALGAKVAISTIAGLVGVAAIEALALEWFRKRI